jgi:saccharopine dehydrogenase-like NADP-dependent oxidoreductase
MKTVVLGGYGNFGARICRALAGDASIRLVVAGRDAQRAEAFAQTLATGAEALGLDAGAPDLTQRLRAVDAGLVIHTAGPFQQQGYAVAEAAAAAGAHYIDLADGRRFVCDLPSAMGARFRAAERTAIAGASTVPALSSAVVDHLCRSWRRIHSIDLCIAPAQTAPRGLATLQAVLGYCGRPIEVWTQGRWQTQHGWAAPEPVRFQRLRPRLGALCDIPDLELFPSYYRVGDRVMFRAALEVGLTQRSFAALAWLTRQGLLRRPERMAGLLLHTGRWFDRLGSALGGMVVRVQGEDAQGRSRTRAWHIAADHDHGPEIPCMAAILLARRLAHGQPLPVGAHACVGLLALEAFQPEFARWGMVTDVVDEG